MPNTALNMIDETPATESHVQHTQARQRTIASPYNILLVEDDASDTMLTEMALDAMNVDYDLHTLENGMDVLPYLCHQGKFSDESKPDMMLLDLSLPSKDGFEVLAEMSTQPERFSNIPIVILTGDRHCAFLKNSYELNIAAYITKPCTAEKMNMALGQINSRSGY